MAYQSSRMGGSVLGQTFERIQGLRQAVFDSHDYAEGTRAIREKRQPVFSGG